MFGNVGYYICSKAMITQIGIIAGDIWNLLEENGDLSLTEIYNHLSHQEDRILMSIGWLAREGHITLEKTGEDFQISLRKKK
jgi:DNA-directed RNA polymerase sigma subunit (sigma70/sigma32)